MVQVVSPPKQLTKTCYSCGAGLSYTQPEVKSRLESDYTGCKDTVYYIVCPSCNKEVSVPGFMPR